MSKPSKFAKFAEEKATDDTPVAVPIRNREGEPYVRQDGKPMEYQVVGEYSKQYRENERRLIDKTIKRARKGDEFDAEDAERQGFEKLAGAVVGWTLEVEGKDVPFSRENLLEFWEVAPWSAKDVQKDLAKHAGFFKRASTS